MIDFERCKALFLAAVENHPPDAWDAFLKQECFEDNGLRERVESLLDAHLAANSSVQGFSGVLQGSPVTESESDSDQENDSPVFSKIGRFKVQGIVGRGGMGNVFLAHDESLDRKVALKLPRIDVLGNPDLQAKFLREAKIAAALRHPGLVEIYEYGSTGRFCYLASRWCPDGDLASWLEANSGPQDPLQVAKFIQQLCLAVAYCHQANVLHLDIKPGNILLDRSNSQSSQDTSILGRPMLTDFGLSRVIEQSLAEAHSSAILGTPLYMAPEQAECRQEELGPRTDVFAIGVVLFEMLYGHRPFDGSTPMQVFDRIRSGEIASSRSTPSVPRALRSICEVCLQSRIANRYASAKELADDLGRFLERQPILARPPSLLQRLGYWMTNPERMQQAGATMLSIQITGTFGVAVLIILLFRGSAGPFTTDPWALLVQYLPLFFLINIPSAFVGIQSLRQRPWAIIAGLVFSVAYLASASLMSAGKIASLSVYEGFPAATFMGNYVHAVFASIQLIAFAVAIPAAVGLWSAQRRSVN
jgi:serine/threonine protein kinase